MKRKIRLEELRHMSDSEVRSFVNPEMLELIKANDPHPLFKIFSVGHEGEADGQLVGKGKISVQYFKQAIKSIAQKIRNALPIFHDHDETNSHDDRIQIGSVVGSGLKNIDNKLHSIAATYIYPEHADKKLDIASLELNDIELIEDNGNIMVEKIGEISGLALASSKDSIPGFPDAKLIGELQHFAEKIQHKGASLMADKLTKSELRELIKEQRLDPDDIFDEDSLLDAFKRTPSTRSEHARDRDFKSLKNEIADLKKELSDLQDENKNLKSENEKTKEVKVENIRLKSDSTLERISERKNMNERQKKFVKAHIEEFNTDAEEQADIERDLERFVEGNLVKYKQQAEIFGIKDDDESDDKDGKKDKKSNDGVKSSDKKSSKESDEDLDEYEDPEQNDFIPD